MTSSIQPLVSVITAVYNGERFLEETIQRVLSQTYPNIEYIIIDGGSTDRTLDIIRKYEDKIAYWVSEKDKGIADAFNKGILKASGDYINFQGDGDGFWMPNALEVLMEGVNPETDTFVSAGIVRIEVDGSPMFEAMPMKVFNKRSLLFRMSMPHQGLLTHKRYFDQYGLFDIHNRFCMDYEHLLRAYHDFPKVVTKQMILAQWRADGLGTHRIHDVLSEYAKIKYDNQIAPKWFLLGIEYWIWFKYYVRKWIFRK